MATSQIDLDSGVPLDIATKGRVYLSSADGTRHLSISRSAYFLLKARDAGLSLGEIKDILGNKYGTVPTCEQLAAAYVAIDNKLLPRQIKKARATAGFGYWFRLTLLSEKIVQKMAAPLSELFSIFFLPVSVTSIGVCAALIQWHGAISQPVNHIILAYILFLASVLCHELGHAAACMRYRIAPRGIGVTLYLIFLSFYSDVSACWQLPRWKRAVVDAGGMYVQLPVAAIYAVLFRLSHLEVFNLAAAMVVANVMVSLNPIFRFDGYWLVVDILGVPDLDKRPLKMLRSIFAPNAIGDRSMSLPVRACTYLYSVVYSAVWIAFGWKMIPIAASVVSGLYRQGEQMELLWRAREVPTGAELMSLGTHLTTVVIIGICVANICGAATSRIPLKWFRSVSERLAIEQRHDTE